MNAVAAKPTLPILANVLLTAQGESLMLTTTNLDFGVRCSVGVSCEEEGQTSLPARKLGAIVKSLEGDGVRIEESSGKNTVKISGGGSQFKLASLSGEDFPPLPKMEESQSLILPSPALISLLRDVAYAQSSDEHRPILNGIYVHCEGGKLSLVATDGRRLAVASRPAAGKIRPFILPANTVGELERLLPGSEMVQLLDGGKQVAFLMNYPADRPSQFPASIYLISKVVEGNYPNYRQVIPSAQGHRIQLPRERLLAALQRVALVSSGTAPAIRLKFGQNLLEFFASSPEFGEAREEFPIDFAADGAVEIAFNPRYLIEPLRIRTDDELSFEFRDHLSPGVFRSGEEFLCVVMPLRAGI
jgi:DNA polymerase-3 subunit beta